MARLDRPRTVTSEEMRATRSSSRVIAFLIYAALSFSFPALAGPAAAEVIVVDGDTITIDSERIRLFGIDAPERRQPGGTEATKALRVLIGRETPTCSQVDRDRYGRTVSLCSVRGADLSLEMVRAGHAVVWCSFVQKLRPALLGSFQNAERRARAEKRGIWAQPMTPWRDWGC